MERLKLEVINRTGLCFIYEGYYENKKFRMSVDVSENSYTLLEGELGINQWSDIIVKHYHDEYDVE